MLQNDPKTISLEDSLKFLIVVLQILIHLYKVMMIIESSPLGQSEVFCPFLQRSLLFMIMYVLVFNSNIPSYNERQHKVAW